MLTSNATWIESNGELSSGMDVWFKDGNTFNDLDINNLYLVEHKEYLKLIREVTQPESMNGKYEGRVEIDIKKEEYFDHNQEFF
ncbi:MAG TPA: hypothetical protein VNX68_02925 [Nitrosopumilaceae archaeon]|nr:hypothetical protein [Nitrosopumilaceae archaeon]